MGDLMIGKACYVTKGVLDFLAQTEDSYMLKTFYSYFATLAGPPEGDKTYYLEYQKPTEEICGNGAMCITMGDGWSQL